VNSPAAISCWHSATVRDFTCEPQTGIVGEHAGVIQNLVDEGAQPAQRAMLDIAATEPYSPEADFDAVIAHEHRISPSLGGRSVFDPSTSLRASASRRSKQQPSLFD